MQTTAAGPGGKLPLTEELLREAPSGDLFGWTQNAGMGWNPAELGRRCGYSRKLLASRRGDGEV